MTVIFLPDYRGGNPYQSNLAAALDEDVVFGGDGKFFPLLSAVWSNDEVSVIHLHWLDPYIFAESRLKTVALLSLTVFQLLVLRILGIPVVWTAHNVISHESQYPRLERWFKHGFIRFNFCSGIFVHCEAVEESIVEEYNLSKRALSQQVCVISHGNYIDNYENEISKEQARSELSIDQEKTVYLYFGQIRPYKGVIGLIDEFKSIDVPDSQLLIVGNPRNESIEKAVKEKGGRDDRIRTVLEFVPDEDIQLYMSAADCVVLPYNKVATAGSAILAMSFRKAVIIPQFGCIPELLDTEGSFMYSPEAEDGLRTALRNAPGENLTEMGNHNYELVRGYKWETIADTTSQLYSRVK